MSPTGGRSPVLPQQAPKDMAAKKRSMSAAMDFLSCISLNAPIKTTDHSVSNQNARYILAPAPSRKPPRLHDQGHEAVAVCHEDGQLLPRLSQLSADSSAESRGGGARLEEELDAPHALHAAQQQDALNPAQPPPPTHTKDHKDRYQVRFKG